MTYLCIGCITFLTRKGTALSEGGGIDEENPVCDICGDCIGVQGMYFDEDEQVDREGWL